MTTPPDPNTPPQPLTEAELARLEELLSKATAEKWSVARGYSGTSHKRFLVRGPSKDGTHFGGSEEDDADMELCAALRNYATDLIASARENQRWRHAELLGCTQAVRDGVAIDDAMTEAIQSLTAERDERIRANLDLCEQIKKRRVECDRWKMVATLHGPDVVSHIQNLQANHDEMVARNKVLRDRPDLPLDRVEINQAWKERDAALSRVRELEARVAELDARPPGVGPMVIAPPFTIEED